MDTHVLLWWLMSDPALGTQTSETIAVCDEVWVSTVSAWEMSIKAQLGKLTAPDDLAAQLTRHQFSVLPLHLDHALQYRALPLLHRDPFDRMLIAQAQVENLTIVSADHDIAAYDVAVLDSIR